MERPSHIVFDPQSQYLSRRLPLIGLALSLQFAAFWLFTHGLVSRVIHFDPGLIEVVQVPDTEQQRVKPPEPHIPTRIENPPLKPPIIDVGPKSRGDSITPPTTDNPPHAVGPDRPLVSIAATHTVPPYPPIARRIGAEGKVTLRLIVSAEGRVSQADIVTSSGREDMDQTAQQWIVAHWAYKPALDKGVPTISHALATVVFSLTNGQ